MEKIWLKITHSSVRSNVAAEGPWGASWRYHRERRHPCRRVHGDVLARRNTAKTATRRQGCRRSRWWYRQDAPGAMSILILALGSHLAFNPEGWQRVAGGRAGQRGARPPGEDDRGYASRRDARKGPVTEQNVHCQFDLQRALDSGQNVLCYSVRRLPRISQRGKSCD
jgi:hypothetical protein